MQTETSTEAARVVGQIYEAFGRKDAEAALALFDPAIEIRQSDALPWGGSFSGHEGALQFFGTLMAHIDTHVEIDRLIVAGDSVVEVGRTCGRATGSGTEFEIDEVHVWTVRDGLAVRMEAYVDDAAMLEAIAG